MMCVAGIHFFKLSHNRVRYGRSSVSCLWPLVVGFVYMVSYFIGFVLV
jgi:hypothetical protein